jgi:hypothetical protein
VTIHKHFFNLLVVFDGLQTTFIHCLDLRLGRHLFAAGLKQNAKSHLKQLVHNFGELYQYPFPSVLVSLRVELLMDWLKKLLPLLEHTSHSLERLINQAE